MKKLILVLLMLFVVATVVFAQEKPTVVIVPFDAKDVNQSEVDVISDVFLSEYVSTGKAIVVDRGSFDKIKREHQFQLSEWSDATKVAQLGKALNAHQVITGQISKFGSQIVCTIKLVDVNTTEILSTSVKRVSSIELLFDECITLSKEIAIKAKISGVYDIGDKGPGGGIIFLKDGDWRWEISDDIGKYNWDKAREITVDYNGFSDWKLPDLEEMTFVYNNLVEYGLILNMGTFWTSVLAKSDWAAYGGNDYYAFSFTSGKKISYDWSDALSVRLVRKFNINNANKDTVKEKLEYITQKLSGEYKKTHDSNEVIQFYINGDIRSPCINYEDIRPLLDEMQLTSSLVFNIDGTWELKSEYIECNFSSKKMKIYEGWHDGATYSRRKYENLYPLKKAEKKYFSVKGKWSVKYEKGYYYIYINDESKNSYSNSECWIRIELEDNFTNIEYSIPIFKFKINCKDQWHDIFGYKKEKFNRDL